MARETRQLQEFGRAQYTLPRIQGLNLKGESTELLILRKRYNPGLAGAGVLFGAQGG